MYMYTWRTHSDCRNRGTCISYRRTKENERFAHCAAAVDGVKNDYVAGYDPVTRWNSGILTVSANSQAPAVSPIHISTTHVYPNGNQATRPVSMGANYGHIPQQSCRNLAQLTMSVVQS